MEIDKVEQTSPFFDDLTTPPQSKWFGYAISIPTASEAMNMLGGWVSWVLEEASRFGELGDEMIGLRAEVDNTDEVYTGIVGDREINSKVRVTAINGIQNTKEAAIASWEKISALFTTRIHFVYNETKGSVATDGTHAVWDKYVRESPKTVKALADHWQRLLDEMGDGGMIYHIAHSHGALLTTQAADMVSPQVRSRLIIRTFGAFQSPHHKDFADLKNIICPDDPVIWLNNYEDDGSIVRVQGVPTPYSFFRDPAAFLHENHSLTRGPYWRYLTEYEGYNFRKKYESYSSKFATWVESFWAGPDKESATQGAGSP